MAKHYVKGTSADRFAPNSYEKTAVTGDTTYEVYLADGILLVPALVHTKKNPASYWKMGGSIADVPLYIFNLECQDEEKRPVMAVNTGGSDAQGYQTFSIRGGRHNAGTTAQGGFPFTYVIPFAKAEDISEIEGISQYVDFDFDTLHFKLSGKAIELYDTNYDTNFTYDTAEHIENRNIYFEKNGQRFYTPLVKSKSITSNLWTNMNANVAFNVCTLAHSKLVADTRKTPSTSVSLSVQTSSGTTSKKSTISYLNPDKSDAILTGYAKRLNSFSTDRLVDVTRINQQVGIMDQFSPQDEFVIGAYFAAEGSDPEALKFESESMVPAKPEIIITDANGETPAWVADFTQDGYLLNNTNAEVTDHTSALATPFNVTLKYAADNEFGEHSIILKNAKVQGGYLTHDEPIYEY